MGYEDNIISRIKALNDYLYDKTSKKKFNIENIILGNILIENIKYSTSLNEKYLKEILECDHLYLFTRNDIWYYVITIDSHKLLMKISFYDNISTVNSYGSKENIDSVINYILSALVIKYMTPHILCPVINFDVLFDDIKKLFNLSDYQKLRENITSKKNTQIASIRIKEYLFDSMTLEEYLSTQSSIDFKNLLFQVLHTLSLLQKEFEYFQHNSLGLKTIYVYKKKITDVVTYTDFYTDNKFYIYSNFNIKIGDFEESFISSFYGINPVVNKYYDVYTFLFELLPYINKVNDDKLHTFYDKYLPEILRNHELKSPNDLQLISTPLEMISDDYFSSYKKETYPSEVVIIGGIRKIKNDNKSIKKINRKINKFTNSNTIHSGMKGGGINQNTSSDKNTSKAISGNKELLDFMKNIQHKYSDTSMPNNHKYKVNQMYANTNQHSIQNINKDINDRHNNTNTSIKFNKDEKKINHKKHNRKHNRNRERKDSTRDSASDSIHKKQDKNQYTLDKKFTDRRDKTKMSHNNIRPPINKSITEQDTHEPSKSFYNISYTPGNEMEIYPNEYIYKQQSPQPMQKIYNITTANPLSSYTTINKVYEDMLPVDPQAFTYLSLYERKQLIIFLRNNLLSIEDGEELNKAGRVSNLLSYIKISDLNPYTCSENPLKELPRNFLLYRGAYPIKYDTKLNTINNAKTFHQINIRIYMLSLGDIKCKELNKFINSDNFDVWREIKYYDFIKNEILNRKVSPNFIAPILYKIDSKSIYNWDELDKIRYQKVPRMDINKIIRNQKTINKVYNDTTMSKLNVAQKTDLTQDCNKSLILLTEAPSSNIIQWTTPKYISKGSVETMVKTGYYTPDIWQSIIFQLVYAFAVMQKKEIFFNNFSLEKNVYIKNISYDPTSIGSWIYKVNNIEYYVPNYGYILMIDSKYNDIDIDFNLLPSNTGNTLHISADTKDNDGSNTINKQYKIYGTLYSDNSIHNNKESFSGLILDTFKKCVDPDNYCHYLKIKKGSLPDDIILDLFKSIKNNKLEKIEDYIFEYFKCYTHNRIGTNLTKTEKENIHEPYTHPTDEHIGKPVVMVSGFDTFIWVLYLGNSDTNPQCRKILSKNKTFQVVDVNKMTLNVYPLDEKLKPESRKNMKYDDNYIYESYNLDNLL